MKRAPVVVVGGGHAAAQLCGHLAAAGAADGVVLVCAETIPPYQRPPLSKSFLQSAQETPQWHRDAQWYAEHGVELLLGRQATAVDRARRELELDDGRSIAFERLVLATGARSRAFAPLDSPLRNVHALRSAADAAALRDCLLGDAPGRLSVLGGGFVGLEVASSARKLGWQVDVYEAAPRLLPRSTSPGLARHLLERHEAQGTSVHLGCRIDAFDVDGDRLRALRVAGRDVDVQHLLLAVGAVPETALAQRAGLRVDNGIVVDARLTTSDPSILAIGDCSSFELDGSLVRLEAVANANDQARVAADVLLGRPGGYRAQPWFWTEQGGVRVQIAGLWRDGLHAHERRGAAAGSFSLFHYAGQRLQCVESVNAPADHMAARKLLQQETSPPPSQVVDAAVPLRSLAA